MFHRPFLKWPGNKFSILGHILPHLSPRAELVEPFVGTGSVFLNTQFSRYILNDINADLIALYRLLQSGGPDFIDWASQWFVAQYNTPEAFYTLRDLFNHSTDLNLRAGLLLYLNRHGYNGLIRYNQEGKFNVPFGYYVKPYFPKKEMLFFHQKSKNAQFYCLDYANLIAKAHQDMTIYCDPPYVPLSLSASFSAYVAQKFAWTQQEALVDWAQKRVLEGANVFISNHDTLKIRQLYHKAQHIIGFYAPRRISCRGAERTAVPEVLAMFMQDLQTGP